MSDLVEPWDLQHMTADWTAIENAFAGIEEADRFAGTPNQPITSRQVDESQPGGHQVYVVAHQLITIAMDHHHALLALISQPASAVAPWTLMRAVFEASARANWILDPTETAERKRHAWHRTCNDFRQQQNYQAALRRIMPPAEAASSLADETKAKVAFQNMAASVGLPWEDTKWDIKLIDELAKLGVVRRALGADAHVARLEAMWRSMSGHAHGYSYAARANSNVRWFTKIDGGSGEFLLTIDPDAFTIQAKATAMLLLSAMQLYVQRSMRPLIA